MTIKELGIAGVKLFTPKKFGDERGFFSETWNAQTLREAGLNLNFVQDNHVYTAAPHTVRGLHFQLPPRAQDKLIRVVRGAIFDVAVDVRRGSPTFGRHVSAVLSAENWAQLLVPKGFAHAYATLEADTEVIYKVTDTYAPEFERGLYWNDPALGIAWPMAESAAQLSERDRRLPTLSDARELFD